MEIALLWDKDTLFREYLLDRGITCETVIVMPNTLSAPFFSFTYYKLIIVPAGFGNELYSGMLRMLKVLRANSVLIKDFVNDGGTLDSFSIWRVFKHGCIQLASCKNQICNGEEAGKNRGGEGA